MATYERVPCERCGEKTAWSAEHLAVLRAKSPDIPPFLVPGICVQCLMADPAAMADAKAWLDAKTNALKARVRGALVRPLEAIDRFVESLK